MGPLTLLNTKLTLHPLINHQIRTWCRHTWGSLLSKSSLTTFDENPDHNTLTDKYLLKNGCFLPPISDILPAVFRSKHKASKTLYRFFTFAAKFLPKREWVLPKLSSECMKFAASDRLQFAQQREDFFDSIWPKKNLSPEGNEWTK